MVDVVNKQPVIKILILKLLKTMVKSSAQIEPFQVSKGNEICFILFFCNFP